MENITGTQVNFYFHCHRQLWLFSHHINTEQDSDEVLLGRIIHDTSYERERHEIEIGPIKVDFLDIRVGILHEVKKSDSWSEAHEWQLLYYLHVLKQYGFPDIVGELNYPVVRRTLRIELSPEREKRLLKILADIRRIISLPRPPEIKQNRGACKKCSYYELCWIE